MLRGVASCHGGVIIMPSRSPDAPGDRGDLLPNGWLGLAGWQRVFPIEGVPASLLAALCPILTRDWPEDAAWLQRDEQIWLRDRLDAETNQSLSQTPGLMQVIVGPMMLILTRGYLLIGFGVYAKTFFLLLMIKTIGYGNRMVGYRSALPNLCGCVVIFLFFYSFGLSSDRISHVASSCLLARLGLMGAGPARRRAGFGT